MISTVLLPADPTSPAAARHFVTELLGPVADGLDVVELLTSELVTNAVLHARTPLELAVSPGAGAVRVSVRDASTAPPVVRDYDLAAVTGRGLQLIERLADRWGADVGAHGKTVWFEVALV